MNVLTSLALTLASFAPAITPAEGGPTVPTAAAVSEVRNDRVVGLGRDSWDLTLAAGVMHTIVVRGDGSSDLDVYLYDENENVVAFDDDATDLCILQAKPRRTGSFTLVIRNRGVAGNSYSITLD